MDSVEGFFSGGGRTAKFPLQAYGTTISGEITAVHPPEPQTDLDTGLEIPGKTQIRIELQTADRDPQDITDDGKRTLYCKGWMKGAIADALRKAVAPKPVPGARLDVTYTGDGPPTRPGLNGPKLYSAVYVPGPDSTQQYFGNGAPTAAAAPVPAPAPANGGPIQAGPPKGITAEAWAGMPEDAKRTILASGIPF